MVNKQPCPCGSKQSYQQCCLPFHNGEIAPTAEKLMRSRYSAYHFGLINYIKQTWHPKNCPKNLSLESNINWVRLKIVSTKDLKNNRATVHFIATYKKNGKAHKLEENSLFECNDGIWFYKRGLAL